VVPFYYIKNNDLPPTQESGFKTLNEQGSD